KIELDAFSVFAGSWRVRNGQVEVPGGDEAIAVWEGAVGEKASRPGRFLLKLATRDSGRLFFYYDAVDALDPVRQRFALGLGASRRPEDSFRTVRDAFSKETTWWKPGWGSFSRSPVDAGLVLREIRVLPSGDMAPPAGRVFWRAVFGDGPPSEKEPGLADAPFLVHRIATAHVGVRRPRLDPLRLAQRIFADIPPASIGDAVTAVQAIEDRPALVYMLERMGFRDPTLYAEAVRSAHRFDRLAGEAQARALGQFQGALLLLDRARLRRTIDLVTAARLLRWRLAVPRPGGGVAGRVAD